MENSNLFFRGCLCLKVASEQRTAYLLNSAFGILFPQDADGGKL